MIQLENWHFETMMQGGGDTWTLSGRVYGHPRFDDGAYIHLSQIVGFDEHAFVVKTNNTTYFLGECDGDIQTQVQYIKDYLTEDAS